MQVSHPLYDSRNRRWLKQLGIVLALLTLIAELFVSMHGYFSFADVFGFYGVSGLVATFLITIVALILRVILQRPEDYYGD